MLNFANLRLDCAILCKRGKHVISVALGEGITGCCTNYLCTLNLRKANISKCKYGRKTQTGEDVTVPIA